MRYLMRPSTETTPLFDREDVFLQLDNLLVQEEKSSVAMHGLGGVGKSTIAYAYLERKYNDKVFDVCLLVRGETELSLRQSFTDIALGLKLDGAQQRRYGDNLALVQGWLKSTSDKWLIVYDNVENAQTIMPYWASSAWGKAIITTRNPSLALEPAPVSLEVASLDDQMGQQFLFCLLDDFVGRRVEAKKSLALALSRRLKGQAVALQNAAGLIREDTCTVEESMTKLLTEDRTAHGFDEITAFWDFSFKHLDEDSLAVLGVLSFVAPDHITRDLLEPVVDGPLPDSPKVFYNLVRLSEVISMGLLSLGLIQENGDLQVISLNRVVQTQFKRFLGPEGRRTSFCHAVTLIHYAFFSRQFSGTGQLLDDWEICAKYAPHVISITDCFLEERAHDDTEAFSVPSTFHEFLTICERYMRATGALNDAEKLHEAKELVG
ncbi:hypothetical protein F5Y10DRAFT_294287 [Nemania abortiva]|nr:hypothetical protein F5Y10DRAFT_294287 [Nemania abortiva]